MLDRCRPVRWWRRGRWHAGGAPGRRVCTSSTCRRGQRRPRRHFRRLPHVCVVAHRGHRVLGGELLRAVGSRPVRAQRVDGDGVGLAAGHRRRSAIAAGMYHTCALLDTTQVVCWGGSSDHFALGNTNTVPAGMDLIPTNPNPTVVAGLPGDSSPSAQGFTVVCVIVHRTALVLGCSISSRSGAVTGTTAPRLRHRRGRGNAAGRARNAVVLAVGY